ncbi:MAG: hypothetical protein H6832_13845 [Planctomycetes bacterium]|nr:hypothetical protein [Planctomycetota bacterium]MCB9891262.1 hypothetical protein [Planctomycetota bacterium]MCB9919479.1 hypothetical protein [Planctomycetota bacterium]
MDGHELSGPKKSGRVARDGSTPQCPNTPPLAGSASADVLEIGRQDYERIGRAMGRRLVDLRV